MFKTIDGKDYVYQWSTNVPLIISDKIASNITEVHFFDSQAEESIGKETYVKDDVIYVDIPNKLLQRDETIVIWGVKKEGDMFITKMAYGITLVARQKPSDYVLDEEDVKLWSMLEEEIKFLKETGVSDEQVGKVLSSYLEENPLSPEDVGADPAGTAEEKVSEHNTSEEAHSDIRLLITDLSKLIKSLLDSDDETLNQTSEIVAYIKSNKSLIDAITTSKVSVADIIDNLTTSSSIKPLSAKQGVALKALIDAITVPTKTSQLTNDSGFLTSLPDHTHSQYLTEVPEEYITEEELEAKGYASQDDVDNLSATISDYRIKGKNVIFFGDSICYGAGSTGGYATQIQEITGCIANNQGKSGATIANYGTSTYKIIDVVAEFSGDTDYITIQGGANDYNNAVPLGEITNGYVEELDTTTFCGALESIIQTLIANYPLARLFGVFMHRAVSNSATNSLGLTIQEYHDKAISIYKKYAIPYYDAFTESGLITCYSTATGLPIFSKTLSDTYTNDGDRVHPNADGYEKYYTHQIISMLENGIGSRKIASSDNETPTETVNTIDMSITGFVRESGGTLSTASTGRRSDYISLENVVSIALKVGGYDGARVVAFYDSNKSFLADVSISFTSENGASYGWYENTIDVSNIDATYFIISSYHNSIADSVFDGDNDFSYDSASYTTKS